jgi:hypothetical protein
VAPVCECGKELDRIDRYGIDHEILDGDEYRPVNVNEGLASETDLRCGYCGVSVPREHRQFFYERWWATKQVERNLRVK